MTKAKSNVFVRKRNLSRMPADGVRLVDEGNLLDAALKQELILKQRDIRSSPGEIRVPVAEFDEWE